MALVRREKIPNGNCYTVVRFYSCDSCHKEIYEAHPHTNPKEDEHYCWDCSFKLGVVDEKKYLSHTGIGLSNAHADVRDGKIVIWVGKRPPWKKTNKDIRNSSRYAKWRTAVFERDQFTCQHCNQVGGELNAHHVKPFAHYKELRFEVSNGLTLCVECHRELHKIMR